MATNAVNERDKLLDATVPRLIDPYGVEPLTVTGSTSLLRYVATPAAPTVLVPVSTISIFSTNTRGAEVSWSILGNPQGVSLQTNTGAATILTYTTGLTQDTVTVRASIVTPLYSPTSLTKDFILTKQVPSQTIKNLLIYRRDPVTAPPATPTGGTYVFSTGVVSAPSGWSVSIPTGTDPVYSSVCQVQSYNDQSSTTIPITQTWSLPTVAMQDGAPGDAVDIVFIRSATQLTTPPTPSIDTPPGWESNVGNLPSTPIGAPIWSSTGTKATGSLEYVWNTPVQQSGTAIAELTIYKRQPAPPDPAPATPVGGSYNFSTKFLTTPQGWFQSFPEGEDPVYTSRAVVSTSDQTAIISVTQWSTPVLTVQNGQDASVTVPNIKLAIESASSTTISLQNHSEFFKSTASNDTGVFIGGGGLYGKKNGITTFGISATTGDAVFHGNITGGANIDITGQATFKGNVPQGGIPVAAYAEVTNTSGQDVGFYATISRSGQVSSPSVYSSAIQGRVTGSSSTYTVGVLGANTSSSSTAWAGYFVSSSLQYNALKAEGRVLLNGAISAPTYIGGDNTSLINWPHFYAAQDRCQFKNSTDTYNCFEIYGTYPVLRLSHQAYSNQWLLKHDNTNLVIQYNNANNDLILSSQGDLTARGNVTAYSDSLIKQDVAPISNATFKLKQINGYQYKNLLANKLDCGIIAQEVEKILPELVQVGLTEFEGTALKTVNYNGLVALLVASNRELISRVEALEKYIHDNANNRGDNSTTDTE